jgi:molecular chaperone Hsp33
MSPSMLDSKVPSRETDELWVAVSADGQLRGRLVLADVCCADAVARHGLSPLAALALARGITCTALIPVSDKTDLSVSVQWAGGGVLGSVFCEVRPAVAPETGVRVRGRVKQPAAQMWAQDLSKGQIGRALLPGVVRLMRHNRAGTVSHGEVPLVSGELSEDLQAAFETSEQVPTKLSCAVSLDGTEVRAARGALVQALPGCDPARIHQLELAVEPDMGLDQLVQMTLGDGAIVLERSPVAFACPCSRSRALQGLAVLGRDQDIDMIVKDKGAEVKCEMCAAVYRFSQDELLPLVEGTPGEA